MKKENNFYEGVNPPNFETKCPVVFVLDRSGSMDCAIDQLNQGLASFEEEMKQDEIAASKLDVAVISFGSDHTVERDFNLIDDAPMPQLTVNGTTKLVDATRAGIDMIKARKEWYRNSGQTCYRPYLILITDGYPDSDQDVPGLALEIKNLAQNKSLNFWPIAVKGADMDMLARIAADKQEGSLPPMTLEGLEFVKLFTWLSDSFKIISNSKEGKKTDISPTKENNPFQFAV